MIGGHGDNSAGRYRNPVQGHCEIAITGLGRITVADRIALKVAGATRNRSTVNPAAQGDGQGVLAELLLICRLAAGVKDQSHQTKNNQANQKIFFHFSPCQEAKIPFFIFFFKPGRNSGIRNSPALPAPHLAFWQALPYNGGMKFNSYFVKLDHTENSFTGNLIIGEKSVPANFKKVENDFFVAYFKNQIKLKYLESPAFKNKKKKVEILLPVLNKYNKRKLGRIIHILEKTNPEDPQNTILDLLSIDKFLRVQKILDFFSFEKQAIVDFLIEMELNRKIKIIDFNSLYIISHDHFQNYLNELKSLLNYLFENRINTIKFSEIEAKIKISQSSILFKYLLSSLDNLFSFKILKDKILLEKVSLNEQEEKNIETIEALLKVNRRQVFSIEDILKSSGLKYNEINDSLWYLVEDEQLIQVNQNYFIFSSDFTKILNRLKKFKRNQGEMIDIQAFRELTMFNRKSIITMLEYLDSQNITQRVGNKRKILLKT
jgi:hypothetical protein